MFLLKKTLEISAAHRLNLPYPSKCNSLHGHNYTVTIYCKCRDHELEDSMVVDFTEIKSLVHDTFDHQYLNDVMDDRPTAENLARWICMRVSKCYRVDVQESEGNIATYIDESVEGV